MERKTWVENEGMAVIWQRLSAKIMTNAGENPLAIA